VDILTVRICSSCPTAARSFPVPDVQLASMIAKVLWFSCRQKQHILISFLVSRMFRGPRSPACWALYLDSRWPLTAIYVLLVCAKNQLALPLCSKIFSLSFSSNKISGFPYSARTQMNALCLYLCCPALRPPLGQSNGTHHQRHCGNKKQGVRFQSRLWSVFN
jgi:hypothetical protein